MIHLTVFPLSIQPGNTFPDHVNISRILVWKSNRKFQKHVMDLFEVVKCSIPVYIGHYMHNFKRIKYKCESPDSPVELFSFQHLFNCVSGINISQPTSHEAFHLPTAYLIPSSLRMWGSKISGLDHFTCCVIA